jgi:hypothetical protein
VLTPLQTPYKTMKLLSPLLLAVLLFAAVIVPLVDAFSCDANGRCILDDGSVVPCININTNGSCVIMYGGYPVTFRDHDAAPPLGQQWQLGKWRSGWSIVINCITFYWQIKRDKTSRSIHLLAPLEKSKILCTICLPTS